ncbi:hypothetical protein QYE77_09975 [Thermanaerothrix sp. 4228-RoL]|uniref:Uncharacterized protein n=1 Tax=Thermanaerothrix solaris TaxID=3058434 RepID=A0ABU3NP31_9CHLR|nr:hypothetical protein [Thermanaerothrix sp. 4228-RoL]MDT8898597.1 hypothetical protein [Thermanaerothrix sp. 4228-RoL]
MPRLRRRSWSRERFWFALLAVLMALGLAALWFIPPWRFEPQVHLIPLALAPVRQADYHAEPHLAAIPAVSLDLIRQALQERQPQAQAEAVLRQLETPIPTATANRPLVLPATPTASSWPGITTMPVTLTLTSTPTVTQTMALPTSTFSPTAEVSPTADPRPTRTPQPPPPTATPLPTSTPLPPSPTPRPPTATAPAYPPPATPLPSTPPTPTLRPYPPP